MKPRFMYSSLRGEFKKLDPVFYGVFIVSNEANQAYRCKIRSPGFVHLQSIDYLAKNLLIADIETIIGTLDIVFGEYGINWNIWDVNLILFAFAE